MWSFGILYLIAHITTFVVSEDVIVTIPNGKIKGRLVTSSREQKNNFYSFQQIPFAKPPVGNLRFREPVPAEKWNGVLDATKDTKVCYQLYPFDDKNLIESEDCLTLNLYTPKVPNLNNKIPVLVWIYGGGFVTGQDSFSVYGPHLFMDYGIIVVSISYRVGPFGFLSTGDTVIPGNYGLKDQNLALKWVKNNIKYFGGDPEKITIFGGSAGGASVIFHLQSKMSHGLYRAAITESGSSLVGWSYRRDHKEFAYSIAKKFNASASTSSDVLQTLQSVSARDLKTAASLLASYSGSSDSDQWMNGFSFTPSIEPEHNGAFVTQYQYEAIESGQMARVPLMMGMASEEMLSRASDFKLEERAALFDKDPTFLVSQNMHINSTAQEIITGRAIQAIYGSFQAHPYKVIKFYSDTVFARPLIAHAKMQSKFSDVYFYEFSYHGVMGKNHRSIDGCEKVQHGEDGKYMWITGNDDSVFDKQSQSDRITSERMNTLLTNFVKYLDPTPNKTELLQNIQWPKVTPSSFRYLNINSSLSIETDLKKDVYDKWVKIYNKYGTRPYDTY